MISADEIDALRGELTGALIGLARATRQNPKTETTCDRLQDALRMLATSDDAGELRQQIDAIRAEKALVAPGCAVCTARCGFTDDYDMRRLELAEPSVRHAKALILHALLGAAVRPRAPIHRLAPPLLSLLAEDLDAPELLRCASDALAEALTDR